MAESNYWVDFYAKIREEGSWVVGDCRVPGDWDELDALAAADGMVVRWGWIHDVAAELWVEPIGTPRRLREV